MHDLASGKTLDAPAHIAEFIRCTPDTPRRASGETQTLGEIRKKVETLLRNDHMKSLQPPAGVRPLLKCWMELL